jgi:predicted  nucleic acid-binding Zn-ribbon protein
MKMVSILLRVIAILGACAAVAGWVLTQGKLTQADEKLAQKDQQVQAAQQQASEAQGQLEGLQSQIRSLDSDLGAIKDREAKARSQLSKASRDLTGVQADLDKAQKEVNDLKGKNESLKRELIDQRTKVPGATDATAVADYQAQIDKLQAQVQTLNTQLTEANQKVQSAASAAPAQVPTARVDPSYGSSTYTPAVNAAAATTAEGVAQAPAPTPMSGEQIVTGAVAETSILKVDHANGIIIISRPQQGGLERQMEFGIVKGLEKPVRLKATKVEPTYIITNIVPGDNNARIYKEGDKVSIIQ